MKAIFKNAALFFVLSVVASSFSSCLKDKCLTEWTHFIFEPVYKTLDEIRTPIQNLAPRTLERPGKIYLYEDYILINEMRQGIHIIDNSNPTAPTNIGFIEIPGNLDIAIENDVLYADNYIDLLAIDFSNPLQVQLLSRAESAFPILDTDPERGVLVYYQEIEVTEKVSCDQVWTSPWFFAEGEQVMMDAAPTFSGNSAQSLNSTGGRATSSGVGGSMARFTINRDVLYIVDNSDLRVFSLSNPVQPLATGVVNLGMGIETIFPYEDYLFIGSTTGMFICDATNPLSVSVVSTFQHATACDPVIVANDVAYVTLSEGRTCGGFINQLDVIDVSDVTNPTLMSSFGMEHPRGLSIMNNELYLCEGTSGLKVFNNINPANVGSALLTHVTGFHAYDVITVPGKEHLLIVGDDGFYQYDASNPAALQLLSHIPVY